MKKAILTAAVLIFLFLLLPVRPQAAEITASGSCGTGVSWSVASDGTLTISGTGAIKSYSNGSAPWYSYRSSIHAIVVEDGITFIPKGTFYGCGYVYSLVVPFVGDSIKNPSDANRYPIGYIFGSSYYSSGTSVTQLYYGSNAQWVTTSDYYIPHNLQSVTVTGGLVSYGAFSSCAKLKTVNLGAGVTGVQASAFTDCSSLTGIWTDENNPVLKSDSYGVLFSKDGTNLIQAPMKAISGAYRIPDGVSVVGSSAFKNCRNLLELTIPEGVTRLEASALESCSSLQTLVFPDSLSYIGTFTFADCTNLTSITFGKGVLRIEQDPFADCVNLTDIYLVDIAAWCESSFWGYSSNPMCVAKNLYLNGQLLTNLVIPDGVTSIVNCAFYKCTSLKSVKVPASVTKVGFQAFLRCTNLTAVILEEGVTTLASSAFEDCTGLKAIAIPASITKIDNSAFYACSSLEHVAYAGTQNQWNKISVVSNNTDLTNAPRHYQSSLQLINDCVSFAVYCPGCEKTVIDEKKDGSHQYDNSVILKPATFANEGQQKFTCTLCAASRIQTLPRLVGDVSQWNITLTDNLQVNFYLQISDHITQNAQVIVRVADHLESYPVTALSKTDDGLYRLTIPVAAAQMHDQIRIAVVYSGIIGPTMVYTVRQYADILLADKGFSKYHTLIREMLNYGIAAQRCFDYNAETLTDISGAAQHPIPAAPPADIIVSGSLGNVEYYGASLIYRDRIAVRFYFQSGTELGGLIFTADSPYTIGITEDMVYVEVSDILPQDLDRSITLSVSDASSRRMQVTYSPMNYIVRMNQNGDQPTKNLVKALYNYHLAAKALDN